MTENGVKKHPVRTLTVENFSVIKHAKLEFGKITVLIGPQAHGKSLLCKLAFFLGKEVVEFAVNAILSGKSWVGFLEDAAGAFRNRFPVKNDFTSQMSRVTYASHLYEVRAEWIYGTDLLTLTFSTAFSERYDALSKDLAAGIPSASGAFVPGGISSIARREDVWISLHEILSEKSVDGMFYIPSGRAFFTNLWKGNAVLQNAGIDPVIREFSGQILWGGNWKNGLLTTGRGVTDEINRRMTEISQGFVIRDSGIPFFLTIDGRKIPLELLSSGTQELLPLFDVLEQVMFYREHTYETARATQHPPRESRLVSSRPFLYLEEPETSVFPETQFGLVRLFAWLYSDPILAFRWVITTHSPYILTAFNTLIEAWRAGNKDGKREQVSDIIPEKCWVNENDFAAYTIRDGVLTSIFQKETEGVEGSGLIDGDYLDSVSDEIGGQFDKLLDIEYAE